MAKKQFAIRRAVLILPALFGFSVQQLQCTSVADGCDKGTTHDSILRSAVAQFDSSKLYGGNNEPVIFSTSLSGTTLAQISYTCLDGSVPPAAYGSIIQSSLQSVLSCPNRCGSIPMTGSNNCGLGVLITEGADADCFSKARDVTPNGRTVPEKPSSGTFNTIGCWTDSTSARALTGGSSTDQGMTLEKCVGLAQGFKYAGLEYAVECHWGNVIASTSSPAQGQCNMPCGGDATELCGGGNLLNIYQDSAYAPPPTENPGVGTFQSLGCRMDSTDARVLTDGSATDWTGMTVASCIARAAGFRYAGVEYYGECYWGNTLAATATAATDCDTKCTGNQTEFCGGSGQINVYEDMSFSSSTSTTTTAQATSTTTLPTPTANTGIGSFELQGCYTDSSTDRALNVGSSSDSTGMTVSKCVGLAGISRYAAVENFDECYWGDVLESSPASDGCSTACTGNELELCGGVNSITLYQNTDWVNPNPTLEELIEIVNDLTTLVVNLANAIQEWRDAVIDYHNANGGSRKKKRDPRSAITTAFQTVMQVTTVTRRKIGSALQPGPMVQPVFNWIELDDRSTDPRSAQLAEEGRALVGQSDNMISYVDSSRASTPDSELSIATEASTIVGTADEAVAVAQAGYGAVATGTTIFGFSFRKLLAMLTLVLAEVLNHPIISPDGPTSTSIASPTTTSASSSSTSSAPAATATYVLYPVDGSNNDQTDSITQILYTMVEDKTEVYVSDVGGIGINFWKAPLTEEQSQEVGANSGVASIELYCTQDCYDPTEYDASDASNTRVRRALVGTNEGGAEMLQVSQEQGTTPAQYSNKYVYDDAAGEGSTIYMVDQGGNLNNPEFTNGADAASRMRWLTIDNGLGTQQNNDSGVYVNGDGDLVGRAHGTCMLGRAVGDVYGIAKKSNVVIVRVPWRATKEHYLEGVAIAFNQIGFRRDTKVVVSLSWHYYPENIQPGWDDRLRVFIRGIIDLGGFVVTGAGNQGRPIIRGFPGSFARTDVPVVDQIPSLLVVGAVDSTGQRYYGNNNDFTAGIPSVYATGMNAHCADGWLGGIKVSSGTSIATATVAGLAAYFYSIPAIATNVATPAQMKAYIESLAWTRFLNLGPNQAITPVIWNGVTAASLPNPIPSP